MSLSGCFRGDFFGGYSYIEGGKDERKSNF